MKNLQVFTVFLMLLSVENFAQSMKVEWSDPMTFSNGKEATFQKFLGQSDNYIYVMLQRTWQTAYLKQLQLVAIDKKTNSKISSLELKGFPSNKKTKKEYKDFDFQKIIVIDSVLYILWSKSNWMKGDLQFYLASYSLDLKPIQGLVKVYDGVPLKGSHKWIHSFFTANQKLKQLLLGIELSGFEGEDVVLSLQKFDKSLNKLDSFKLQLPFGKIEKQKKVQGVTNSLSSAPTKKIFSPQFADDGFLHFENSFNLSAEQHKNRYENNTRSDTMPTIMGSIDLKTGELYYGSLQIKGKRLRSYKKVITKDGVTFYGFYHEKSPTDATDDLFDRSTLDGIFVIRLTSQYKMKKANFTAFTKEQLFKLYDKGSPDPYGFNLKEKDKLAYHHKSSLDGHYHIESLYIDVLDNAYLTVSHSNRSSSIEIYTDSKGNTSSSTSYENKKSDVLTFKLNNKGELIWMSNILRFKFHDGNRWVHYINDVKTLNLKNELFCIFPNSYDYSQGKADKIKEKDRKPNYAFFNKETGEYKRFTFDLKAMNSQFKENRSIIEYKLFNTGNNLYTFHNLKDGSVVIGKITPEL